MSFVSRKAIVNACPRKVVLTGGGGGRQYTTDCGTIALVSLSFFVGVATKQSFTSKWAQFTKCGVNNPLQLAPRKRTLPHLQLVSCDVRRPPTLLKCCQSRADNAPDGQLRRKLAKTLFPKRRLPRQHNATPSRRGRGSRGYSSTPFYDVMPHFHELVLDPSLPPAPASNCRGR